MAKGVMSSAVACRAVASCGGWKTFLTILLKIARDPSPGMTNLVAGRQLRMRNFAIGYHADTNSKVAMAFTRGTFWRLAQVLK